MKKEKDLYWPGRRERKAIQRFKRAVLAGLSLWFAAAGDIPAAAAQIKEVKIRLAVESFEADGWPCVEAYCASSRYTVTGVERTGDSVNTGYGPSGGGPPETELSVEETEIKEKGEAEGERTFEIELTAEEEDGFAVMEQKDIRFSGIPAACTKAIRKDSGQTLLLTVALTEPGELAGEIAHASLDGASARWEAAPNASSYLVMLFRDQKRVGYSHRTAGLEYDFSPLMQECGVYFCKVYPLTESGKKGNPAVSGWKRIGAKEAGQIRKHWEASLAGLAVREGQKQTADSTPGLSLGAEPEFGSKPASDMGCPEENGSSGTWYTLENNRIYLERDGCVPQENWLLLDGRWYCFGKEGALKTDCWQEWKGRWYYLDSEGRIERESDRVPV